MEAQTQRHDDRGQSSVPGEPQPRAAEVESARLLANDARDALHELGMDDAEIQRYADEFIALGIGSDVKAFIEWSRLEQRGKA